jgi:hypothetical protein
MTHGNVCSCGPSRGVGADTHWGHAPQGASYAPTSRSAPTATSSPTPAGSDNRRAHQRPQPGAGTRLTPASPEGNVLYPRAREESSFLIRRLAPLLAACRQRSGPRSTHAIEAHREGDESRVSQRLVTQLFSTGFGTLYKQLLFKIDMEERKQAARGVD